MEKLVDSRIKSTSLLRNPLHPAQFAFQKSSDAIGALHNFVSTVEKHYNKRKISTIFLDISQAFDKLPFNVIMNAARDKEVDEWTTRWIENLLHNRYVVKKNETGEIIQFLLTEGAFQGSGISPLFWNLSVDSLIKLLADEGLELTVFADDFAITIIGEPRMKHDAFKRKVKRAAKLVTDWCDKTGLNINPDKTNAMAFGSKQELRKMVNIKIHGKIINYVDSTRYLGVIIDHKLRWHEHVKHLVCQARKALWAARHMVSLNWGLTPKAMLYIYKNIILPRITFASIVWWPRTDLITEKNQLNKVQRLAMLLITNAFKTTPNIALMGLLNLNRLHVEIKKVALYTYDRLVTNGRWKSVPNSKHGKIADFSATLNSANDVFDTMPPTRREKLLHKTTIIERANWKLPENAYNDPNTWFTDGSKRANRSGLGVYNPKRRFKLSLRLSNDSTVMQAETRAITECVTEIIRRGTYNQKSKIYIDSRAAILSMRSQYIRSKTVLDCLEKIEYAVTMLRASIELIWCPSHSNVEANNWADFLANEALDRLQIDRILPKPGNARENAIEKWCRDQSLKEWWENEEAKHSKDFLDPFNPKSTRELLNLKRDRIRSVTSVRTGHAPTRSFLKRFGKSETTDCRFCPYEEEEETMRHVLTECLGLAHARSAHMTAEKIKFMNTSEIEKYIIDTGIKEIFKPYT